MRKLLSLGVLNGNTLTVTGETMRENISLLRVPPDGNAARIVKTVVAAAQYGRHSKNPHRLFGS